MNNDHRSRLRVLHLRPPSLTDRPPGHLFAAVGQQRSGGAAAERGRCRFRVLRLAAALVVLAGAGDPAAAEGNPRRGERAFQRCFACHSVDPAETARLEGPSLYGVVGRPAAAVAGYAYSEALRARAAAGLVWDGPAIARYIADPQGEIPGTRMTSPPMGDAQERADIVAYLASAGRR